MNIPSFITRHRFSFALAIIIAAYLAFGLHHIDQFITADEHYWVEERIPQYWDAISDQKWKKTFINDKPGVSLALVSGIGLIAHPESAGYCEEGADKIIRCDGKESGQLYADFRLPIIVANAALLILIFFLVSKISSRTVALWTTVFSALSPILLGMSQIINPDSLLWSIGGAAVFSYLAFLKLGGKRFFWATTTLLGFSLLTKYAAFILIPFFFALILGRFLFDKRLSDSRELSARLKKDFFAWSGIVIGSIAILCLFLPALLIDSKYVIEFFSTVHDKAAFATVAAIFLSLFIIDTFALGNRFFLMLRRGLSHLRFAYAALPALFLAIFIGLVVLRHLFPGWDIFAVIPFDIKDLSDARYVTDIPNFFEAFILEWNPLVFSFTPIMLIGLLGLFIAMLGRHNQKDRFIPQAILFLALAYSVLLILSNVLATPRYSILLYPLFAFLAALGISELCRIAAKRYPRIPAETVATAIILLASIASLISIRPFYANYSNFLLPDGALIHDAWGYGGYEAAQYLNALPDAEHLTVWSDYYGVCEFFVGRCLTAYTFDPDLSPDYYVLTRRGGIRYRSRYSRWERLSGLTAYKYYMAPNPEWQLLIDNQSGNFIKVMKVSK